MSLGAPKLPGNKHLFLKQSGWSLSQSPHTDVPFSEQTIIYRQGSVFCPYKDIMDPVTVIAIFLLGASAGSLITPIRFRTELNDIRTRLDQIQLVRNSDGEKAAEGFQHVGGVSGCWDRWVVNESLATLRI